MKDSNFLKPIKEILFMEIHLLPEKRPTPLAPPKRRLSTGAASFALEGVLEDGTTTVYAIDGEDFVVTADTWVVGVLKPGVIAQVRGVIRNGTQKIARSVKILTSC